MIGNHDVIVTWKKMKNIRLIVSLKDASVKVSAPYWSTVDEIVSFVIAHEEWIGQKKKEIIERSEKRLEEFQNGAICLLWGKKRELKLLVDNDIQSNYEIVENGMYLELKLHHSANEDNVEDHINDFYYRQMILTVPPYIEKWSEIMDVTISVCSFKKMKTRWGSCNPSLKKINLNIELAKFEIGCLEYVIVHELAHFYELKHNDRFWRVVEQAMPHWVIYHNQLNDHKIV